MKVRAFRPAGEQVRRRSSENEDLIPGARKGEGSQPKVRGSAYLQKAGEKNEKDSVGHVERPTKIVKKAINRKKKGGARNLEKREAPKRGRGGIRSKNKVVVLSYS